MRFLLLLPLLLMTACSTPLFKSLTGTYTPAAGPVVTQDLKAYSPAFQKEAAIELAMLDGAQGYKMPDKAPACAADATAGEIAHSHCSALRRLMADYHEDRKQGRRLGAREYP